MKKYLNIMEKYSKEILRIWTAIVYLWFGFSQLIDPGFWSSWLPKWVDSFPIDTNMLIYINWWVEVVLWLFLILWFKTRIAALLMSIHMLAILWDIWYNANPGIFVRDFWILVATFVVFLNWKDSLSLDSKISNKL